MPANKKLNHGELSAFARFINEPADRVRGWQRAGKMEKFIKQGQINKDKAAAEIYTMIAPRQRMSAEARWDRVKGQNQNNTASNVANNDPEALETEAEIQNYMDKSIGDLSRLPIYDLQRFNELEKLLMARLKRRREDRELIPAEPVQRAAFEAGQKIKDRVSGIADRCCALVAAETDAFACKQILLTEINFVLEGLAKTLAVETGEPHGQTTSL